MSTYFVNALGSSTAPYDTADKGAVSLTSLRSLVGSFSSGDIIEVTNHATITNTAATTIPSNVTVRAWSGNTGMPTMSRNGHQIYPVGSGIVIKGIIFSGLNTTPNAAIYVIPTCTGLIIDSCKFLLGVGITIFSVSNIIIKNCLFRCTAAHAIYIDSVTTVKILNNTFYDVSTVTGDIYLFQGTIASCKIVNNVFYAPSAGSYAVRRNTATLTGFSLDYNDAYGYTTPYSGSGVTPGAHSILTDPLLDPSLDGSLLVGSPCMNTGVGPTVDADIPTPSFNNTARSGSTTDMGAYKYTETPAVPVANFFASPLSGNIPVSVVFTDATTGVPTSWDWDFGDGSPHVTTQNPTHIYTTAAVYTVVLIATNGLGSDTETKVGYITISPTIPIVANFIASPLIGLANATTVFTDTSTGGVCSSWDWDFGDGSPHSILQNPTHIYTVAGTYTVTLIASNSYTSDTEIKTNYITVNMVANFTGTPTLGPANLSVAFTDTSAGTPTSWDWDFGDGSTHETTQNPTHIYTVAGFYTVTLVAANSFGASTEIKTNYIIVKSQGNTLLLSCGYDTSGCVIWGSIDDGVTWAVKYSDASGGRVNRICVGAGQTVLALTQAGNILRSVDGGDTWTDLGVKVAVPAAYVGGIVHVSGSIFVANGSRTVDNGDNWTVVVSYTRCIGKFSDGTLIAATTDVLKRSIDGGLTWSADITHTNPGGGYTVATPYNFLDLGIGIGILVGEVWYDSVSNTRAYITRTTDYGATWPGISYVDMVGSGSPSPLSSRVYDAAGMPAQDDWSVFGGLHVAGLSTPAGGATATSNMLKSLNIGGAWTAGALSSQYFYGLYYSVLAAKLFGGLIGSSAIQVSLNMGTSWSTVYTPGSGAQFLDFVDGPPPSVSADFVASPLEASMGELICFDDLSVGSPTSWLWNFGDDTTSILQNPSHQYAASGTYTVSLIATNSAGSDTEIKTAYITISVVDFVGSPRIGLVPLTVQFTDLSM